ncbi:PH domain containing protein, partial [Euroglyphus maynei]
MQQSNGVMLKVRKKDCHNTIAFVDIDQLGIFIAGWKQRDHPYLHNTFHIGDQLISINGMAIETVQHAKDFIKQQSTTNLDFIIRRVPFGQIYCLKRSFDGEDLGIVREKGTAKIINIIEQSVAERCGLHSPHYYHHNNDNDESSLQLN